MNTDTAMHGMIEGKRAGLPDCRSWYEWRGDHFVEVWPEGACCHRGYFPQRDDWEFLPDLPSVASAKEGEPCSAIPRQGCGGQEATQDKPELDYEDVAVQADEGSYLCADRAGHKLDLASWLDHADCLGAIFELPDGTRRIASVPMLYECPNRHFWIVAQEGAQVLRPKWLRFRRPCVAPNGAMQDEPSIAKATEDKR